MKTIFLGLLLFFSFAALNGQTVRNLSKKLELQMPAGSGTRGASVAWHPSEKKFYASFAGNASFPMAVFTAEGRRISGEGLTAQIDTRGLWYNTASQKLFANGYNESGWARYSIDLKGTPETVYAFKTGMHQPSAQSVGTYCEANDEIWFLKGTTIWTYDPVNAEETFEDVLLFPGITKTFAEQNPAALDRVGDELSEDYNYTSVIYTKIPGAEAGLLNLSKKQVELYDMKTGYLTQVLKLPADVPVLHALFDFAYANGYLWIFDEETRKWVGYK
jgi:hypothetical protein